MVVAHTQNCMQIPTAAVASSADCSVAEPEAEIKIRQDRRTDERIKIFRSHLFSVAALVPIQESAAYAFSVVTCRALSVSVGCWLLLSVPRNIQKTEAKERATPSKSRTMRPDQSPAVPYNNPCVMLWLWPGESDNPFFRITPQKCDLWKYAKKAHMLSLTDKSTINTNCTVWIVLSICWLCDWLASFPLP